MITAWRIVDPRFADDAFSGKGARLHGGRWNARGTAMVYTADVLSLATLELIVNVPRALRLREYAAISCAFHEAIVEDLDLQRLPESWRMYPAPPELQEIGEHWIKSGESAVLKVPSAVIPDQSNYLLNPGHAHFNSVHIGLPRPFKLDARLLT